jgi:hypothetical protein
VHVVHGVTHSIEVKCEVLARSELDEDTMRKQQRPDLRPPNTRNTQNTQNAQNASNPRAWPRPHTAPRSPLEIPRNRIRRLLSQILEEPREVEARFPAWCGCLSRGRGAVSPVSPVSWG